MFVVNFDALAQASDIRIERRQLVFHCWLQDSNPGSQTPNRWQTECPLTNRPSARGQWVKQNEVWTVCINLGKHCISIGRFISLVNDWPWGWFYHSTSGIIGIVSRLFLRFTFMIFDISRAAQITMSTFATVRGLHSHWLLGPVSISAKTFL